MRLNQQQQMQTSQPHVNSEDEHGGHHQTGPLVVFFVFFGLLCGAILREFNKKTGIPYTPMLLILGIILGYFRQSFGVVGDSVEIIQTMSPHMILLVFIPILIFESAFNCDWHVFRKSMLNILLLAGPGVLWGAIIIAFMFKSVLGYGDQDLTWYEACALGCVLSATDPVAVVALLKELGASVKFNTLVQGQSLLNDGTAMVFFMLFMSLVKGQTTTVLGVVTNFIRVSIGGPLLGLVVGFIISWWMKKIIRDSILSVNITFIGTFLCFYIAEFTWLKVSGILSIVCLGLYFSAVGKRKIYPQSEHALHNVWASIQYGSETLIFVLTGIIVGISMVGSGTITSSDWLKMFVFWFLMILSRVIMVLTFYPLIVRSGYGLTIKQLVVLIYGGLRGALGMCLSLFVGVDESLNIRFRELTVFYMCGMAMLTIIVNGLTCSKLVDYLQMVKVPEIKEKLLKRCIKRVLESTQDRLKVLKTSTSVSYAKWKDVQRDAKVKEFGGTFYDKLVSKKDQVRDSFKDINRGDIVEQIRFRFTRFLQKLYWHYYQQGELSEQSIQVLVSSCKISNDEVGLKIRYFDILSGFFELDSINWLMRFKNVPIMGKYCTRAVIHKIYFVYEVSTVFVEACEEVIQQFNVFFPLHQDHLKYVLNEISESVQNATSYINQLENSYPKIIQAVHTERATTILLKNKKNKLTQLFQEGYVDDKEYAVLRQEIDLLLVKVRSGNNKLEQIKFSEVITQCPLFSVLSPQELVNLRMKAKEKTYLKDTILLQKGKEIPFATIVISGSVKEKFEDFYIMRSIGCILNPYDFTFKQVSKCEAKARNDVKVLEIDQNIISELLNTNTEFKKRWYKSLFIYCFHHFKGEEHIQKDLSDKEIRRFIEAAEVSILECGQSTELAMGAYVFTGQVESERSIFVKGSFIAQNKKAKALTDCIIFKFRQVHGGRQTEDRKSVLNQNLEVDD